MTTFIALQPATGQEMSRHEMRHNDAIYALQQLRCEGGAGYVVHGGKIVATIPCRDVGQPVRDDPLERRITKRLARRVVWDWGNARVSGRKKP